MGTFVVAGLAVGLLFAAGRGVVRKAEHVVVRVFRHDKKAPAKPDKGKAAETKKVGTVPAVQAMDTVPAGS